MLYCDSLAEGGYDNWVIPTIEEIMFVAGGGGEVPGVRTSDWLCTGTVHEAGWNDRLWRIRLDEGSVLHAYAVDNLYTRCVRHESIAVSSSNGSSTPSTLGSGMPTMISNESDTVMFFISAMNYCDTLVENGNTDWVMPTFNQLTYAISGGCVIPDGKTVNYLWTRSIDGSNLVTIRLEDEATPNFNGNYNSIDRMPPHSLASWAKLKCRCVR